MKVSYNWLKSYVNTLHSPEKLAEVLTDTGLEVEGLEQIEAIKGGLKGVVIGEVLTCTKHENADRLNVTTVNIGADQPLQIVCGAPNVAAKQKVVVATVGTTLYPSPEEAFKIKKSKIRGVESYGMICAEDELGLGNSHNGIMVLPETAKIGQPAADFFHLTDDYCIEIGLTPNRSDAMGHIGVARDIVAFNKVHELENTQLEWPDINNYKVRETGPQIKINVQAEEDCPIYKGCIISNIKIKSSPDWLKNHLLAIGLSPINNVVDVTNFVLHELGNPLHAFDLNAIGEQIVVKKATDGAKFTTLDGVEHSLSEHDLMITNGQENLCLAGIFGGKNAGVNEHTTAIFLEAAYFNPITIRKAAKRHGLNTDASFRFERGVDPNLVDFAMKRAATLIAAITEGTISYEPIPFESKKINPVEILFHFSNCKKIIGKDIPNGKIIEILNALEFEISHVNEDQIKLCVPTFRIDVTREIDVIEEVLRIYGYNNIDNPEKWNISLSQQNLRSEENRQNIIANLLVANGFFEMMNNSLISSQWIENFGGDSYSNDHSIFMLNPLSNELDVLRQSIVFQGLKSISHNINRQQKDIGLFEFGKIYQQFGDEYIENKRLGIFLTGNQHQEVWNTPQKPNSFYTLKGIVNAIFTRLGLISYISTKPINKSLLIDGIQLFIQKQKIGEIGWTSTKMNKEFGVKQNVYVADLNWDTILNLGNRNKIKFTPLPKTFEVRRDFSLLLDHKIKFDAIVSIAQKATSKLLKSVQLFDVYEGDKLPKGKKSYAVSFFYQDDEKTLNDKQIDQLMNNIKQQLEKQLAAELR